MRTDLAHSNMHNRITISIFFSMLHTSIAAVLQSGLCVNYIGPDKKPFDIAIFPLSLDLKSLIILKKAVERNPVAQRATSCF